MRPVNLIPPEERRGDRAPLRSGSAPYVLLAFLGLALVAVVAVVMTGKQISERESKVASLEAQQEAATQRAEALRPFAEFAAVQASRQLTVTSLATSRFDWERVLRELALVMPTDVWLVAATASATGDGGEATAQVAGPSLALTGCAAGHEAVAELVASLKDIDGVTRVGLESSERPEPSEDGEATSAGGDECRTRDFISKFEVLVAFDGATAAAAGVTPEAPAPATEDVTTESKESRANAKEQVDDARDATELVPGTVTP